MEKLEFIKLEVEPDADPFKVFTDYYYNLGVFDSVEYIEPSSSSDLPRYKVKYKSIFIYFAPYPASSSSTVYIELQNGEGRRNVFQDSNYGPLSVDSSFGRYDNVRERFLLVNAYDVKPAGITYGIKFSDVANDAKYETEIADRSSDIFKEEQTNKKYVFWRAFFDERSFIISNYTIASREEDTFCIIEAEDESLACLAIKTAYDINPDKAEDPSDFNLYPPGSVGYFEGQKNGEFNSQEKVKTILSIHYYVEGNPTIFGYKTGQYFNGNTLRDRTLENDKIFYKPVYAEYKLTYNSPSSSYTAKQKEDEILKVASAAQNVLYRLTDEKIFKIEKFKTFYTAYAFQPDIFNRALFPYSIGNDNFIAINRANVYDKDPSRRYGYEALAIMTRGLLDEEYVIEFPERTSGNNESLLETISECEELQEIDYRQEGWNRFARRLTEAKTIANSNNATQHEMDVAEVYLEDARDRLIGVEIESIESENGEMMVSETADEDGEEYVIVTEKSKTNDDFRNYNNTGNVSVPW